MTTSGPTTLTLLAALVVACAAFSSESAACDPCIQELVVGNVCQDAVGVHQFCQVDTTNFPACESAGDECLPLLLSKCITLGIDPENFWSDIQSGTRIPPNCCNGGPCLYARNWVPHPNCDNGYTCPTVSGSLEVVLENDVSQNHNFSGYFPDTVLIVDVLGMDWTEHANCSNGPDPTYGGNSCGIHIHEGYDCSDAATIGGHFYDTTEITPDPWTDVTYFTEGASGDPLDIIPSEFMDGIPADGFVSFRLDTGLSYEEAAGRTVIVHDVEGNRIACANIECVGVDGEYFSC